MSIHGWIAASLGITLTVALWLGLVYLMHISARDGHDDIHRPEDDH